jgi:lipopolysaccharide export system protein LptA
VKDLVILIGAIALLGALRVMAQQSPTPSEKTGAASHRAAGHQPGAKPSPGTTRQAGGGAGGKNGSNNDLFGGGDKDSAKGPTVITATQEAQFDTKTHSGVFIGNVKVVDPQFTMTADRLTVHLNRDEDGGGLREALAEGHVVIVHVNQPKAPEQPGQAQGDATPIATPAAAAARRPGLAGPTPAQSQQPTTSIGRGDSALYEAKDGSVTLTGWPQVTQAGNTHIATAPGVKMVLYRDGRMQTFGSTRTLIEDKTATNNPNANSTH